MGGRLRRGDTGLSAATLCLREAGPGAYRTALREHSHAVVELAFVDTRRSMFDMVMFLRPTNTMTHATHGTWCDKESDIRQHGKRQNIPEATLPWLCRVAPERQAISCGWDLLARTTRNHAPTMRLTWISGT